MVSSTYRGLEAVPTPSSSANVVCLSPFPGQGVYFVVTHVFRHEQTSKYRDHQSTHPPWSRYTLAGVILATSSEIGIHGDSMFMTNWASNWGGKKDDEKASFRRFNLKMRACKRKLFTSTCICKEHEERDMLAVSSVRINPSHAPATSFKRTMRLKGNNHIGTIAPVNVTITNHHIIGVC